MRDALNITVRRPPAPTDLSLLAVRFTIRIRPGTLAPGEPQKTLDAWWRAWTALAEGTGPVPLLDAMKVLTPMAALRVYGAKFNPRVEAWRDEVDAAFSAARRGTGQPNDDPSE